ncbi:MAG: hypothetical protein Q4C61_12070, partial [Lachnospiraceae bacterium]|nr:hypothetical protein [Lachnospiraceae bacterium]
LYLPLVGAPNFHKAPHRELLTDVDNVKQFLTDEGIGSFSELDAFAEKMEKGKQKSNQSYQSKAAKLRRLKELAEMFTEYGPYMEIRKEYKGMGGLKAIRFQSQHKEELEREQELRCRILSRLKDGEKIAPKKWEGEIKELEEDCRGLAKKSGEQTFRLAFAEVVRYNRKMFEVEQDRGDRNGERNRQAAQGQQKQKNRKKGMEL